VPPRIFAGFTLAMLLAVSACASEPDAAASPSDDAELAADTSFVRSMIAYHEHDLAVLELAQARAADAEVKDLAVRTAGLQRLQRTTMITLLVGWAQPASVPEAADSHLTQLTALAGSAFDRELVSTMINHDERAVHVARQALAGPLTDRTRTIAGSVDTGLSAEIAKLRQLLTRLDQSTGGP